MVAAVAVSPGAYYLLYEKAVGVTVMTLSRGQVEQTVAAISSGTVVPTKDSMIASGFMGIVVAIPAREGDRVQAGDLLVELDHTDLDAQVRLTEANVEAGLSRLQQAKLAAEIYAEVAKTQVSLAEEQLKVARLDYDRILKLSEEKAVSQSDLDKVALALRVTQENLAAAKAGQRENLVRREQILTARSNVRQLEAAVAAAQATREKAMVKAPFSGVVAHILIDVGEAAALGMPLLQLVQDEDCYVKAPFDEANAAEIAVGQKARLNLDAYRGIDFMGEVVYISPVVSLNRDLSRTLTVKIRVLEGLEKFVAGMSADVTIVVDEKSGVLFVPSESLIRERFAYVLEKGRAARRTIVPGLGNWNTREIVSGLKEGETVITSVSMKELKDGVKVKVLDALEG